MTVWSTWHDTKLCSAGGGSAVVTCRKPNCAKFEVKRHSFNGFWCNLKQNFLFDAATCAFICKNLFQLLTKRTVMKFQYQIQVKGKNIEHCIVSLL